jgi:hypothetical protein
MSTEKTEEVKLVNGKVLAFGLAAVALIVVVICGALIIGLHGMSTRYISQLEISAERQEVIHSLTRALDRAEGKLAVYEEFIGNRREEITQKLIVKYLKKERIKSTDVTLNDFEKWVGMGGR